MDFASGGYLKQGPSSWQSTAQFQQLRKRVYLEEAMFPIPLELYNP